MFLLLKGTFDVILRYPPFEKSVMARFTRVPTFKPESDQGWMIHCEENWENLLLIR